MKRIFLAVMILLIATSAMAGPYFWGGGGGSSSINPGGTGILNCNTYAGGVCTVFTVNSALTTIGGLTPGLNKVIIGDGGTPSAWTVSSSSLGTAAYLSATSPTFLTSLTVSSMVNPYFFLHDSSQAANSRDWATVLASGNIYLQAISDDHGTPYGWFTCDRSGNCTATGTITGTTIIGTELQITKADGSRAVKLDSNTTYTPGTGENSIYWVANIPHIALNGVDYVVMTKAVVEYDNGTCTTSKTISAVNGNRQKVLLTNGQTCALTFTQPTVGTMNILLKITQSGTSSYNGAISGGKWPGGVVPTITATNGAVDIVSCYLDGTNAYCVASQDFR